MPPPHPPAAGRLTGALAVTAPPAVVAGVVPAGYAAGLTAQPLLFAAAGLLLLIFAAGYLAMTRRTPHPGPLYSLVTRGLGRPLGLGAAGLAVLPTPPCSSPSSACSAPPPGRC